MKSFKNTNVFTYGLILLLSLTSFSCIINDSLPNVTQTELVINDVKQSKRFHIQINNANRAILVSFLNYYNTSFNTFKTSQDIKDNISFKTYVSKTRSIISERLQTKLHASFNQKIIYENTIV